MLRLLSSQHFLCWRSRLLGPALTHPEHLRRHSILWGAQQGRLRPRPAFGWRSYERLALAFALFRTA